MKGHTIIRTVAVLFTLIFFANCCAPNSKSAPRMVRASSRLRKVAPPPPVEPTKRQQIFRPALAQYLRDAAGSIEEANVFTLRGHNKWGLSYELQMDLRQYSALLLGCGLIRLNVDGNVDVMRDEWDKFLHGYQLRDVMTKEGVCEFTRGKIKYAAMVEGSIPGEGQFHILRIGEGKAIVATKKINDGEDPPRFGRTIRSAQRRLFSTVSDEMSKLLRNDNDEVESVMKWVKMEDIINVEGGEKVEAKKRPRSPQPSKTKTTQNTKSPQNTESPLRKIVKNAKNAANKLLAKKQQKSVTLLPMNDIPVPKQPNLSPPPLTKNASSDFPFTSAGPGKSKSTAPTMSTVLDELPEDAKKKLCEIKHLTCQIKDMTARVDQLKLELVDEVIGGLAAHASSEAKAAAAPTATKAAAAPTATKPTAASTSMLSSLEECTGISFTTPKPASNSFDVAGMNLGNLLRDVLQAMEKREMPSSLS